MANDTEDGVEGAAAGKALVFDGTHWRAGDAGLNESQLYSYLTANKYLTQSAADSRYVTSSRKVIAGTGLSGGGALTSDVTLSLGTSGVVAGTYTKVMVDAYGRVTSGTNLSATDIPNLDWSKITTGKPTTLAGYGITDAVTLTTNQTISGQKTFTKNIMMNSGIGLSYGGNTVFRNTSGNTVISSYGNEGMIYFRPNGDTSDVGVIQINKQGHLNGVSAGFTGGVSAARLTANEYIQIGDAYLKWDAASNAVYVIKKDGTTPVGFYSTDWLSAKGLSMSGTQTGTLDSLNDVEITDPTNGQALKYDAASKKWVNGTIDSFNVNQMWAELKKADSSKIIDASHIPTSVLDGRWVTISTNQNITGQKTFTQQLKSTVATGLSPLIVSSNTTVDNLSADLLDGYHAFGTSNALIKYGYTVSGTKPAWCRIATYSIRNTEIMTDVCFVLHSAFDDLFGLLVVRTRGTSYVQGELMVAYNINTSNIRIYHDAEKRNIELYCHGGNNYSVIQANLLYSHDRYGWANTNITLYREDTKAPSWSTYVNPVFAPLQNSSEVAKKLQTPRTLWGQSFDGTANVSGDMTGVGSINMSGDLKIGNGTSPNAIYFYGTTGDSLGGYDHTFIAERLWGGTESSELVLFKGNNIGNGNEAVNVSNSGPDRIRHIAAAHLFQTYTSSLWGSVEDVCTSSALKSLFGIAANRVTSYVPFMSTVASGVAPFIVASNTVVGNLNADMVDGLHENSFLRYRDAYGIDGYDTLWAQIGIRQYNNAKPDGMTSSPYIYGAVISLPSANVRFDIWYNHHSSSAEYGSNGIQYRSGWGDDKKPWRMFLDSVNYYYYADSRYVKKAGDTMTGDLAMNNTKGIYITHGTRVVKTSGGWIHGGADVASSTDANLRFGSWYGIGWYPTFSGNYVAQGNNAMWLNVRTGVLNVAGGIKESSICIGRVDNNGNYNAAYNGEINRYDHHLFLQHHSGKYLIMCTGGGLAGIGTNSPGEKLHVAGNTRTDGYFKSTVGTGTQPYQCNSTTLNTNLNADMLDNWHLNFLPRNYNIGRCYAVRFALGGEDNGWKKIFACSESGTGPYRSVTVWGRIWYAYGNHAQSEVWNYHFCAIFYMRSGPSSSDSSVGNVENSARLYLPTFAKGMDNIRLVRVGTNNFELQVRQIGSYHNANIEYQYWSYGCNVSAWENLQSTSNTSVAVSAGGASTLADSRASSADVWTTARTFYIQDYHSANTGAGVSVNGGSNCYLKLPSTTRFSRIDFSTPNANIRHSGNDNGNEVGSSTLSNLVIDSWYGVSFTTTCSSTYQNKIAMSVNCRTGRVTANNFHAATNITANGAITAKASSSDIRLKTDIQGYDAMGIIRKFRSVKYHWNAIAKENSEVFNHDNWNYGLIAQDLLSGGYSQWVKDAFNDYYTIDYERLIPVVWKGLQEVDDEVTKLKREVARLNKRVKELEKSLCA